MSGGHWGVGVSGLYWGLAGTLGTQGPEGFRGLLRDVGSVGDSIWGCQGVSGGVKGVTSDMTVQC